MSNPSEVSIGAQSVTDDASAGGMGCSLVDLAEGSAWVAMPGPTGCAAFFVGSGVRGHLLEGHTWILWYWWVLLMTFSARMLKQ